jgi:uncharacterized membrane protein YkvA (DUF1232 family)
LSPIELLDQAKKYLEKIKMAYKKNVFINLKLAEAIFLNMQSVVERWDNLPPHCYPWLRGMMKYFTLPSDIESDFTSPIGFDDDVEIMNACLCHAGLEELCLNPEDFDDV